MFKLTNYKYFYVNGSSHTMGGGLEELSLREIGATELYRKRYGVSWQNRSEVNWATRLSEITKIPVINESQCGGSPDRSIRMTYDFIYKNWKDKDNFFIILEYPDSSRCDVYYRPLDSYFIVNTHPKQKDTLLYATREYWSIDKKIVDNDREYQTFFSEWVKNHFNLEKKIIQDEKEFIGLYSFCKLNGIPVFLMRNNYFLFNELVDNNDIIPDGPIFDWCIKNKLSIKDEVGIFEDGLIDDHPGYFGHIEYAKRLSMFLGFTNDFPRYPSINKSLL